MKSKTILYIILLTLALSACNTKESSKGITATADSISDNAIETDKTVSEDEGHKFLTAFYTNYLTRMMEDLHTNFNDETTASYLTTKLSNKLQNFDRGYDPIINGQDYLDTWLESITVVQDSKNKNIYYINFRGWEGDYGNDCIKLSLVKNGDSFLIDDILWDDEIDCIGIFGTE